MPVGLDIVMLEIAAIVEDPVQLVEVLSQDNVEVIEPIVTIHVVEVHGIELELGFATVILYVKVAVPEVVFWALIPTVGVLEVLVVKNPVRAR